MLNIDHKTNILYGGPDPLNFEEETFSLGEWCFKKLNTLSEKHVSLINGISNRKVTILEIKNTSFCIAENLLQLKSNDTIGIYVENRIEYSFVALGTLFAGKTLVPINMGYAEQELNHAINISKPSIVFTSLKKLQTIIKVAKKYDFIKHIIVFDTPTTLQGTVHNTTIIDYKSFVSNIKTDYSQFKFLPQNIVDHVSIIFYSSGTTGMPKGVQLTDQNIMLRIIKEIIDMKRTSMQTNICLHVLPFSHVFGCLMLIQWILCGDIIITIPKFEGKLFLSNIQKYSVNYVYLVPPLMVFLAKSPLVENYVLSSIQMIEIAAAPLGKVLQDTVCNRIKSKPKIQQAYGLTETSGRVTKQTEYFSKTGGVGGLLPGIAGCVVCLETKRNVGPNQHGELLFKGKIIMKGYVEDEIATRNMIDENGWLHTGDIGYFDEDGEFFIVDRLKELIKYKGHQVPPAEIENFLFKHPHILDAAVIGIPDDDAGELPMAFIVKKPNHHVTAIEIINFVAERISSPKQLRGGVQFVTEIPKTPSGKILRRILKNSIQIKHKL